MLGRLLTLALVLLTPAVLAGPFVTWEGVGVATQGSVEEWADTYPGICPDEIVRVRITLLVVAGAAEDVLTLRMPEFWPEPTTTTASLGRPGVLDTTFGTACSGRFTIEGTQVASSAVYAWRAERTG